MLFDPERHEALRATSWDSDIARATIQHIVDDSEYRFDPVLGWPAHPRDRCDAKAGPRGLTSLYTGACGVVWALHYLQAQGAASLKSNYTPYLDTMRAHNQEWLGEVRDAAAASYLMGDTPFLMQQWAIALDRSDLNDGLASLIAGNREHPHRELMWGAPGTLLAAHFLHAHSGDARWATLFVQTAATLWTQLLWSDDFQCHYWTQDLYGRQSTYLDGIHGFVATACALIKGRHLLAPESWQKWEQCIVQTVSRTATEEGQGVNWRAHLITPAGEKPRLLMQFCHGAPGFVICLGDLPAGPLDAMLLRAGETIWAAGPLTKGANLCHGTGGMAYAFLKLYQRSGDRVWLERARAFAMHGIKQVEADRAQYGQGQYALWTGDLGFAVLLWDCLTGVPMFPTLDVFFSSTAQSA